MYSLSREEYKSEMLEAYDKAFHISAAFCSDVVISAFRFREPGWSKGLDRDQLVSTGAELLYEELRKYCLYFLEVENEPPYTIPLVSIVFGFSYSTLHELIDREGFKEGEGWIHDKISQQIFERFSKHDYGKLLIRMVEDRKDFEKTSALISSTDGRKPLMQVGGEYAPFNAYEGIEEYLG